MIALLVIGSPKGRGSASFLLAERFAECLRRRGVAATHGFVHPALRSREETTRLLDTVDAADCLVLAFPLYVDSLPAPLIRFMEAVAARRGASAVPSGTPRVAAVIQCGFPEAHQCDVAIGICRLFAERTRMRWAGALAMGMGGQLAGGIEKLPGGGRHVLRALDMAADSVAEGDDVPAAAAALFARPLVPRWMYTLIGNLGWRIQIRKNRARRPIGFRPYEQE